MFVLDVEKTVEIEMRQLVGDHLKLIRLEARVVADDIVGRRVDRAWANGLAHQEEGAISPLLFLCFSVATLSG